MLGLTTILSRLNGSGADPAALAAELAEIGRQRASIPSKRAELKQRRLEALRNDDDKEARKLEAQLVDLDRDEDRLCDSEINVRDRASAARAAADKRAGDETVAAYLAHSEDVARKIEAADAAAAVQRMFYDQNQGVLARLGVEPLGCMLILGDGYGIAWARRTRQVIAAVLAARERRNNPQLAPRPPAKAHPQSAHDDRPRLPHERAKITDARNIVTSADGAPGMHSAAREVDDLAPLDPGQARVKVMRHGYSPAENRPQTSYGQVVRMPRGAAERAANAGAVEVLEVYGESTPSLTIVGKPEATNRPAHGEPT
jgi:hypothetical protein